MPATASNNSPSAPVRHSSTTSSPADTASARLAASLEALSPLAVLARGYSLTFLADAKTLVRNSRDVKPGDLILTQLAAGQIASRVESSS